MINSSIKVPWVNKLLKYHILIHIDIRRYREDMTTHLIAIDCHIINMRWTFTLKLIYYINKRRWNDRSIHLISPNFISKPNLNLNYHGIRDIFTSIIFLIHFLSKSLSPLIVCQYQRHKSFKIKAFNVQLNVAIVVADDKPTQTI